MRSNTKLSCVVLEDEDGARKLLIQKLSSFGELDIVGEALSVSESYKLITNQKPDVAFMDIKLIGGDIFTLIDRLKQNNIPVPYIVCTTAFPEYMINAINDYHHHIVQYIIKPYHDNWRQKFQKAIDALVSVKFGNQNQSKGISSPKYVFLNINKTITKINFDNIVYLEAAGSGGTFIVTETETMHYDNTIAKCLDEIFPYHFIRISRHHAVNQDKILRINREERTVDVEVSGKNKSLGIGEVFYKEMIKGLVR